ncbi:unnamed protein product [Pleuronectes platessa]|uniref:Uncharacterized protein n=1 Tax=Pleuronectes platessa TaxID=8262 RepID=A0A9N7VWY9_PLEPL|nr:unnamed protein product [Pleuronectes platessa]
MAPRCPGLIAVESTWPSPPTGVGMATEVIKKSSTETRVWAGSHHNPAALQLRARLTLCCHTCMKSSLDLHHTGDGGRRISRSRGASEPEHSNLLYGSLLPWSQKIIIEDSLVKAVDTLLDVFSC